MSAPGIGVLTAYLILHEIGSIERFPRDKCFAKYCCVAPGTEQSANWRGRPGVGRAGNLYLKEAFTAAAIVAIGKDPTIRTFYNRQVRRNGAKKARMATARKLAVAVYHMLRRRERYRPAPSRRTKRVGKPAAPLGLT